MVWRDVVGRYKGSFLGLAWSFVTPLLMLLIYTFFFSIVFKVRWNGANSQSTAAYAVILFTGMIVYGLFAECINRAPVLITGNVNFVKKVIFPLDVMPWVILGSALFHALVSLLVLVAMQLIISHQLAWTGILFPLVLLPLVLFAMGFSWLLSSLGVYARDVGQVVNVLTTILMYLSPVFYPVNTVPERYRYWLNLNPLTFVIEEARNVLLFSSEPDWLGLAKWTLFGGLAAWLGFWWFQKTRKGFADVL